MDVRTRCINMNKQTKYTKNTKVISSLFFSISLSFSNSYSRYARKLMSSQYKERLCFGNIKNLFSINIRFMKLHLLIFLTIKKLIQMWISHWNMCGCVCVQPHILDFLIVLMLWLSFQLNIFHFIFVFTTWI